MKKLKIIFLIILGVPVVLNTMFVLYAYFVKKVDIGLFTMFTHPLYVNYLIEQKPLVERAKSEYVATIENWVNAKEPIPNDLIFNNGDTRRNTDIDLFPIAPSYNAINLIRGEKKTSEGAIYAILFSGTSYDQNVYIYKTCAYSKISCENSIQIIPLNRKYPVLITPSFDNPEQFLIQYNKEKNYTKPITDTSFFNKDSELYEKNTEFDYYKENETYIYNADRNNLRRLTDIISPRCFIYNSKQNKMIFWECDTNTQLEKLTMNNIAGIMDLGTGKIEFSLTQNDLNSQGFIDYQIVSMRNGDLFIYNNELDKIAIIKLNDSTGYYSVYKIGYKSNKQYKNLLKQLTGFIPLYSDYLNNKTVYLANDTNVLFLDINQSTNIVQNYKFYKKTIENCLLKHYGFFYNNLQSFTTNRWVYGLPQQVCLDELDILYTNQKD